MKRLFKILLVLLLMVLGFNSCKKARETSGTQTLTKYANITIVKDISLTLSYTATADAVLPLTFDDTVKKTQDLLNKVFASKDFRDELYKRNFHDSAYTKSNVNCFNRVYGGTINGRSISGKAVYDNLIPGNSLNIAISIRNNGDNITTLGSASACGARITTNHYWLKLSERKLANRLARHWAHEYTHIRGYRHDSNVTKGYEWGDDVNQDPAYGVGDIVGLVLDKWLAAGIIK